MQNKIFIFLIAGVLFISMLTFAIAQSDKENASPNLISAREQINETRNQINQLKERINELKQNISEIRRNWTDYREQIKQQVKDQRMTFVSCVSDSAKVKNDCFNAVNERASACRISTINNSDNNATKQCLSEHKDARAECKNGFKETKKECNNAKHNFFDSLRVMFK